MNVSGQHVAVVGMARSGMAALDLLLEKGAASVRAVDEQPSLEVTETLQRRGIELAPQTDAAFKDVDLVVISPGVPADAPVLEGLRKRGVPVLGELELASYWLLGPVIGITGSNGKTTTTALTGHILKSAGVSCQVGGNIGTAPAAMVGTSRADQWNVLELSSFQLETIRQFRAKIGAVLNVTPDHLDRHYTFENYAAAKARIFDNQDETDFAVLNADDPTCLSFAAETPGKAVWFSSSKSVYPGFYLEGDTIRMGAASLMDVTAIPLRGRHNVENVMAAAAISQLAGAAPDAIAAGVRSFPGVEHRLEFVAKVRGVEYFNDSKATNVDATVKALEAFPGGLWVILGGKDKGSDYTGLRELLHAKARGALLIGAAAAKIGSEIEGSVPVKSVGTLDAAVAYASAHAQDGDTVLLAPACASFDQFDNFEHRGRVFKDLVAALRRSS